MKKAANRKRPAVNKIYYIYVGILAVLFFIFHTIPFLKGVFYSFTDWRGYGDWNFVGLRNYLHILLHSFYQSLHKLLFGLHKSDILNLKLSLCHLL